MKTFHFNFSSYTFLLVTVHVLYLLNTAIIKGIFTWKIKGTIWYLLLEGDLLFLAYLVCIVWTWQTMYWHYFFQYIELPFFFFSSFTSRWIPYNCLFLAKPTKKAISGWAHTCHMNDKVSPMVCWSVLALTLLLLSCPHRWQKAGTAWCTSRMTEDWNCWFR
jgi:hypothetical protein